jgi:hypothetical protein
MKYEHLFVGALAALTLFSLSAFASNRNRNEGKMTVGTPVEVGSTQLAPGNYKVEWSGTGDQVKVNIMDRDKTVVTVPAKLVTHAQPSSSDALVTTTPKTNGKTEQRLVEIDFNHRAQALVLQPNRAVMN